LENVKIMEEKELIKEINQENLKLEWEAPKLFCLDKGKTEGGPSTAPFEDTTNDPTPS